MEKATQTVSNKTIDPSFKHMGKPADDLDHEIRLCGERPVQPGQKSPVLLRLVSVLRSIGKDLVGYDDQIRPAPSDVFYPLFYCRRAASPGTEKLVPEKIPARSVGRSIV